MREIKFRGQMINFECGWLTGYFFKHGEKTYIAQTGTSESGKVVVGWEEVDPETVGQYTGLKDKNDVEIYDGDILEINDSIFVVEFDEYGGIDRLPGFYLSGNYIPCIDETTSVIGNKYDNPELLKEVEK